MTLLIIAALVVILPISFWIAKINLEKTLRDEWRQLRQELDNQHRAAREEQATSLKHLNDSLIQTVNTLSQLQKSQLDTFSTQLTSNTQQSHHHAEKLRETVDMRLTVLQQENAKKLEEMRLTVDEKLHATLEKRLSESFNQVGDRLEKVHQGLGEMQALATGVGDLKKVLTNVKSRGIWGELQLESLLDQILIPEQYAKNIKPFPHSNDFVEFAVKFPGKNVENDLPVWLPIDSKFPQDAYQQLLEAHESANLDMIDYYGKQLDTRLKTFAKDISQKYIHPPYTTDFAILFLPVEGLFAEVLRRPGLSEMLQTQYRVTLAGPTTLGAILNSLRMGFRTMQIEKKSSEVWKILGGVKAEFGRFGDLLDKTQKKLQEAGNTIDDAARRSRAIERQLKNVETPHELEGTSHIPVLERAL